MHAVKYSHGTHHTTRNMASDGTHRYSCKVPSSQFAVFPTHFPLLSSLFPLLSSLFPLLIVLAGILPLSAAAQISISWRETVWNDDFARPARAQYTLGRNSSFDSLAGNVVLTPNVAAQTGRIYLQRERSIEYFDWTKASRWASSPAASPRWTCCGPKATCCSSPVSYTHLTLPTNREV